MIRAGSRRGRLVRSFALVAIAAVAMGGSCDLGSPGKFVPFPSFDGQLQGSYAYVDEGNDGSFEAEDLDAIVASGSAAPGLLSSAAATQTVSITAERDAESILVHCEHALLPGTSQTGCQGSVVAAFDVATAGSSSVQIQASSVTATLPAPGTLTQVLHGEVTIDCGGVPQSGIVDWPAGVGESSNRDELAELVAAPCLFTIQIDARIETSGLAVPLDFVQTIAVSVTTSDLPECSDASQCPAEAPFCDANGACGTGDEGEPAVVAAIHCDTPFVTPSGCSRGVSGSLCRADFECVDGNSCNGSVCVGDTACTSDVDCPPGEFCSEQGTCSPFGLQGGGCLTGEYCRQGLICLSGNCTAILDEGGDCTQPFVICDGGLHCFQSSGTCEVRLPLGDACSENGECADYPVDGSCNQAVGGVCTLRQSSGGPCAQSADCAGFIGCNLGTGTCN